LNQVLLTREKSESKLLIRGNTWSSGPNVAELLAALFVNPFYGTTNYDHFEPDGQPIRDHQARAAILFGPPGTSKTTLIRLLAGALGWKYVEIHASHFVAQGLPNVQKTADELFQRLMELDHTVVLFDEIDELVREREEKEADAFGRFLTTSMLPKLAELWHLRKVIYFVNTNHIRYFDSAITRSGRFDVLLFVPPPSFASKCQQLSKLLTDMVSGGEVRIDLKQEAVEQALKGVVDRDDAGCLADTDMLAKFVLIRWDQLDELASILAQKLVASADRVVAQEMMSAALSRISDQRLQEAKHYKDFDRDRNYARRDHDKVPVYRISAYFGIPESELTSLECVATDNNQLWLRCAPDLWDVKLGQIKVMRQEGQLASVVIRKKENGG
jgi:SpoVK/Ycf46/Vps4 family AAA+-type ATPase